MQVVVSLPWDGRRRRSSEGAGGDSTEWCRPTRPCCRSSRHFGSWGSSFWRCCRFCCSCGAHHERAAREGSPPAAAAGGPEASVRGARTRMTQYRAGTCDALTLTGAIRRSAAAPAAVVEGARSPARAGCPRDTGGELPAACEIRRIAPCGDTCPTGLCGTAIPWT